MLSAAKEHYVKIRVQAKCYKKFETDYLLFSLFLVANVFMYLYLYLYLHALLVRFYISLVLHTLPKHNRYRLTASEMITKYITE